MLSDSTANKDFGVKKELYERSGIREYWINHPDTGAAFQYVRDGALFAPVKEHRRGVAVHSSIFCGLQLGLPGSARGLTLNAPSR